AAARPAPRRRAEVRPSAHTRAGRAARPGPLPRRPGLRAPRRAPPRRQAAAAPRAHLPRRQEELDEDPPGVGAPPAARRRARAVRAGAHARPPRQPRRADRRARPPARRDRRPRAVGRPGALAVLLSRHHHADRARAARRARRLSPLRLGPRADGLPLGRHDPPAPPRPGDDRRRLTTTRLGRGRPAPTRWRNLDTNYATPTRDPSARQLTTQHCHAVPTRASG